MDEEESCSRKRERMDGFTDAVALQNQMKDQEKELKNKRMWLMGLGSNCGSDRKRFKSNLLMDDLILPETILREDDVFYGKAKKCVEKGFRASEVTVDLPVHTYRKELYQSSNMRKTILSVLDDLTTDGLYALATTVTRCSTLHEQTRSMLKNTIKEKLAKVHRKICPEDKQCQMCINLSSFICNRNYYRRSHALLSPPTVQSHFGAIMDVLNGLDDMPFVTLKAMHRRIRGHPGALPSLDSSRSGWSKKGLVDCIRKQSLCILSSLDEQDDVPVPLIKAMAVATLSEKLTSVGKPVTVSFCDYALDVENLQGELIKAINLLDRKVKVPELDAVKDLMFQPSQSELNMGCVRKIVKRVLTELLFECSEFDAVPTSILDAISVLNSSSAMHRSKKVSKEAIEGEVESILRVSAQVKQMLWNLLPDVMVSTDYADAYMEELEESDEGELFDDFKDEEELGKGDKSGCYAIEQLDEDVASTSVAMYVRPLSARKLNNAVEQCTPATGLNNAIEQYTPAPCENTGLNNAIEQYTPAPGQSTASIDLSEHPSFPSNAMIVSGSKQSCRNQYLALQDISDETSLVSYQIIGHLLDDFAREDGRTLKTEDQVYLNGNSSTLADFQGPVSNGNEASSDKETAGTFIVKAVQRFLPSFPLRELEEAKAILKL